MLSHAQTLGSNSAITGKCELRANLESMPHGPRYISEEETATLTAKALASAISAFRSRH